MAELQFDILGERGEVSASTFRESIYYAVSLLREFDSAISGKPTGVLGWYIRNLASNGKLSVLFQSRLKPLPSVRRYPSDVDRSVTSHLVSGFEDIETKCETPPYLSEYGLQRVGKLADLIGKNGAKGFHFSAQSQDVNVTKNTQTNIRKLLPVARTSIGSVEGTLETISIHGKKPRFIVYDAITKKGVACVIDKEQLINQISPNLGKVVAVFGKLFKNIKGDTLRVSMDRIHALDRDNRFRLPSGETYQDDPEFTKVSSTKEYLRLIRGR